MSRCDWCGTEFERRPGRGRPTLTCSDKCRRQRRNRSNYANLVIRQDRGWCVERALSGELEAATLAAVQAVIGPSAMYLFNVAPPVPLAVLLDVRHEVINAT